MYPPPSIDIFIGAPIEHKSERATLVRAVSFLSAQRIPAVVLANVNLGGRQIDLVIGLDQGALVVESKALSSAVRGSESGDWQVRLRSGRWKEIPNAYVQALNEKLALRDAMAAFDGADVPYPDAALIFVPTLPAASAIPAGDFKVSVGGLDDLPGRISSVKHRGWSLNQWRTFATHHRLIAVPSIDAALSHELLDAERLLTAYGEAFRRTYGPPASTMVPLWCVCDGETLSSDIVMEQAARDGNVLLTGQSGCGKSLLSYAIALAELSHGRVPIVIPAKDFEGNLRNVANREATLLDAPSATAVVSAARLLDRDLVLVVDGYNECTPSERQRLTRSIAAAVWRYGANAVISSRITLERDDLLPVRTYVAQVPDIGIKRAIAQQAAGGASVDAFLELLGSVGSGLEARMIGQLGQHLPAGTSKYGLFDAYVRERLGTAASDGIRALSRIANMMTERISFGLSVRELDRLSDREGVPGVLLQALQDASILNTRGDRVSFSHEMFLNVFVAEAIIRRAGNDSDAVVAALRLPRHLEMKPFVLGAIDDDSFRRRVLSDLSDPRVIRQCLAGQCGRDAQLWANGRCDDVLAQIDQEVGTVRFELSEGTYGNVRAKPETLQNWTAQDRAVLAAIPHELVAGRRLDDVLSLIGKMDERLDEEHRRLLNEARERKVALRSGLYAASYAGIGGREIGLCQIGSPLHNGHLYDGPKVTADANLLGRLRSETLTAGQVGLLVELDKYSALDAPSIGTVLPSLLKRLWPRAAQRLRLGLMHAAGMSARALNDDERRALIAVIEDLMPTSGGFDSTGMIDALKFLGALEDDQANHVASVKAQIDAALAERDNPLMWQVADGLWSAQFDHPYDGAYCEAWSDLSSDDRKSLLFMAAQVAEGDSMFTPPLVAEVASHADSVAGPILARWTALPPKKGVMVGDAIGSFEIAHAALARLRCPLPDHSAAAESSADHALLACGAIVYWLNREDLSRAERRQNCTGPLAVLLQHETGVAAAVVGEFFRSDLMFAESAKRLPGSEPVVTSFYRDFPDEIAAIYRAALEHPTRQTGYFEFFRADNVIEKALTSLGRFGNASDIPLLRAWSIHPDHGRSAVRAIKTIEEGQR
jgi:hypothetical protein